MTVKAEQTEKLKQCRLKKKTSRVNSNYILICPELYGGSATHNFPSPCIPSHVKGSLSSSLLQLKHLPSTFQNTSDIVLSFGDFFPGHNCKWAISEQGDSKILLLSYNSYNFIGVRANVPVLTSLCVFLCLLTKSLHFAIHVTRINTGNYHPTIQ